MSLVKKYFLSNFTYRTISACNYLLKDTKVNCAQYYTCLNSSVQSRIFNHQRCVEHNSRALSVLTAVRESNFIEKAKTTVTNLQTMFPSLGRRHKKLGYYWFQTLDEINVEDFITLFKMEDTFYSWFQIIELHVWMLLCHLPKEGRIEKLIRAGVIEAMWMDSEKRAKSLQAYNKNFRKNFKDLYGEFLFSQLYYDYSFPKSDVALTSAVWVSFFNKQDTDPRLLEALVSYIRYQMHHLNKINMKELTLKEEKSGIWAPVRPHVEDLLNKL